MRVLLDEHLPHRLRQLFAAPLEVVTVGYLGWKGLKNGELLRKASVEFDVFITMDKGFCISKTWRKFKTSKDTLRFLLEIAGSRNGVYIRVCEGVSWMTGMT